MIIDNCILQDKDSTNGTIINGEQIEYNKPIEQKENDVIEIGSTKLYVIGDSKKNDEILNDKNFLPSSNISKNIDYTTIKRNKIPNYLKFTNKLDNTDVDETTESNNVTTTTSLENQQKQKQLQLLQMQSQKQNLQQNRQKQLQESTKNTIETEGINNDPQILPSPQLKQTNNSQDTKNKVDLLRDEQVHTRKHDSLLRKCIQGRRNQSTNDIKNYGTIFSSIEEQHQEIASLKLNLQYGMDIETMKSIYDTEKSTNPSYNLPNISIIKTGLIDQYKDTNIEYLQLRCEYEDIKKNFYNQLNKYIYLHDTLGLKDIPSPPLNNEMLYNSTIDKLQKQLDININHKKVLESSYQQQYNSIQILYQSVKKIDLNNTIDNTILTDITMIQNIDKFTEIQHYLDIQIQEQINMTKTLNATNITVTDTSDTATAIKDEIKTSTLVLYCKLVRQQISIHKPLDISINDIKKQDTIISKNQRNEVLLFISSVQFQNLLKQQMKIQTLRSIQPSPHINTSNTTEGSIHAAKLPVNISLTKYTILTIIPSLVVGGIVALLFSNSNK